MKKVGRYVIISELGRGAMGIVYKASDPTIDREVALKVLSLNASQEEGTNSPQEMFMREVRAAGRLAHPSIVTIYDAFDDQENQTSCIVMELVPGVTLEKILGSGATLTTAQSLSIIRQVVEALDYAHRNKVIHRDLKPANILVTDDGRAKITDFGIAKVLAREGVARTIGIMGTPSYMSPEQVKGGDIDARTDIFSLGIMIFTMLTGTKPFSGNTVAVMFKIVYEEPQLPSSLNPQLTPDHDYLIKKCLEKDRNQRYSSARELLNDLDDLEHGRPLRSRAVAPAPVPPSPAPAPHPERTLTLPIPGLAKPTPQQPAPPTPSAAPPPRVAAQPPRPQAPRAVSAPPASPPVTAPPAKPVIPSPVKPVPASDARPLLGKTLSMRVPDLSAVSTPSPASPHAPPAPPIPPDFSRMESTLPMERPDLSDVSPQTPGPPDAAPAPPASPDFSRFERTVQMPDPGLTVASPAAGSPSGIPAPPPASDAVHASEPEESPTAGMRALPSKFIPVMLGGVAVVLLAVGGVYWKFHHARPAPVATPQVAIQTPPVAPPPVSAPVESPTPPPAVPVEQPTPPVSAPPAATKKTAVHKSKPAIVPQPPAPEPEPPPSPPQPVIATPSPNPSPATPSPEDIAKAEAAKLAKAPRVVQVLCNYGLKEARYTFSSGGQTLFEETLKGKKKKEGFLGIKGIYEGTFSRAITLPAGASEVSIHVESKDGATDLVKTIKLPAPGGFVPTLAVEADTDHLSLSWKSSPAAQ